MIRAEVHSDDHNAKVEFDATKWFEQASDEEIIGLAKADFGGDYESDEVAEFFADTLTKPVFDYLDHLRGSFGQRVGFECHVEPVDVRCWLDINRHDLLEQINAIENA